MQSLGYRTAHSDLIMLSRSDLQLVHRGGTLNVGELRNDTNKEECFLMVVCSDTNSVDLFSGQSQVERSPSPFGKTLQDDSLPPLPPPAERILLL